MIRVVSSSDSSLIPESLNKCKDSTARFTFTALTKDCILITALNFRCSLWLSLTGSVVMMLNEEPDGVNDEAAVLLLNA